MARPTKLTPQVQKSVCDAIRHGAAYWAAAEGAGIAYSTFNLWMQDNRPKYLKFMEAVRQANADGMLDHLAKMEQAGRDDWRCHAWILERRFKGDFGQNVDVTSGGEPITIKVVYDNKEQSPEALESAAEYIGKNNA